MLVLKSLSGCVVCGGQVGNREMSDFDREDAAWALRHMTEPALAQRKRNVVRLLFLFLCYFIRTIRTKMSGRIRRGGSSETRPFELHTRTARRTVFYPVRAFPGTHCDVADFRGGGWRGVQSRGFVPLFMDVQRSAGYSGHRDAYKRLRGFLASTVRPGRRVYQGSLRSARVWRLTRPPTG